MFMDEETLKYIKKSSYRYKVVKALGTDIKLPKEIANDSGILLNHISNVLRNLRENGIIECLNPNLRKGRLYRLTDKGLEVFEYLD